MYAYKIILSIVLLLFLLSFNSNAYTKYKLQNIKEGHYLLYDPDLDEIIIANNHKEKIAPSSMTKLMTLYVVFEQLKKGTLKIDDYCIIGKDAYNKYGSTMNLGYRDIVKVSDLISGLMVMSGNDASIVLAQTSVKGGYDEFIKAMNFSAKKLNMNNSNFTNPHGLNEKKHYSTLYDIALLIDALYEDFPQYSHYLGIKRFKYGDRVIENSNPLIKASYDGIVGGKTGYTSKGGYGVGVMVKRHYRRFIGVVNNMISINAREKKITELIDYGFNKYKKIFFFKKNDKITNIKISNGYQKEIETYIDEDVIINMPYNISDSDIKVEIDYLAPLNAPIIKGEKVATLHIDIAGYKSYKYKLYSRNTIYELEFIDKVKLILKEEYLKLKKTILLN